MQIHYEAAGDEGTLRRVTRSLACLAVLLIACGQAAGPTPTAPSQAAALTSTAAPTIAAATATGAPSAATPAPSPPPIKKFPHGLYVVRPSLQHPGGILEVIDADGPLPVTIEFSGTGYDVADQFVVTVRGDNTALTLFGADGSKRDLAVNGLYGIARPSLSSDAKFAVVQATETPISPTSPMPKFYADYVIDLATGAYRRVTDIPQQEFAEGRELPRWFPSGDRILYQTNVFPNGPRGTPVCDVIRIIDASSGAILLTLNDRGPSGCFTPRPATGPRFHAEVSLDSSLLLIPGQMQIYDAKTLQLRGDIRAHALAGLAAAGYKVDTRYPGQGNGGTFPLDGTFSPDNKQIVFDGAVEKDGTFGVLLCRMNLDGSGFTVLRPPVQVEPKFSNNHNYSQVLPHYR